MIRDLFPIDDWDFQSSSILNELPGNELQQVMAHAREQECPRGRFLFREGDVPQGIFFIRCGKVKKCKVDRQGREQIIYVAASGELVGYHALLAQEAYPDSAVTLEDSVVVFIPKADF